MESLSLSQAQKLILLSQGLPPTGQTGRAVDATLTAIERLGYIQIDTISVVERAHHHTLWSRNPRYRPSHLEQLVADRQVFEYWAHAAAYLPMCDYRYSLPRKHAIACGEQSHWFKRDKDLMDVVLKRISDEGPLMARDFERSGLNSVLWKSTAAKRALESLYMQGDLMIARRESFHKVYDLTERVLPRGIDTSVPEPQEWARFMVARYLRANGIGQVEEMVYLRKGIKDLIQQTVREMVSNAEIIPVEVGKQNYYMLPETLELLDKTLSRSRACILSPFDNLLIQRKRIRRLFGYDYLLECYLPAAKRQFGYFSLPVLWDGRLVARMDCKAERRTETLSIRHLELEAGLKKVDRFAVALAKEVLAFMRFNNCEQVEVQTCHPASFAEAILAELKLLS